MGIDLKTSSNLRHSARTPENFGNIRFGIWNNVMLLKLCKVSYPLLLIDCTKLLLVLKIDEHRQKLLDHNNRKLISMTHIITGIMCNVYKSSISRF